MARGTNIDVWFTRDRDGQLWYALARPNQPPFAKIARSKGAAGTLKRLKTGGYKIVTVGICDPQTIGLEDEV